MNIFKLWTFNFVLLRLIIWYFNPLRLIFYVYSVTCNLKQYIIFSQSLLICTFFFKWRIAHFQTFLSFLHIFFNSMSTPTTPNINNKHCSYALLFISIVHKWTKSWMKKIYYNMVATCHTTYFICFQQCEKKKFHILDFFFMYGHI